MTTILALTACATNSTLDKSLACLRRRLSSRPGTCIEEKSYRRAAGCKMTSASSSLLEHAIRRHEVYHHILSFEKAVNMQEGRYEAIDVHCRK